VKDTDMKHALQSYSFDLVSNSSRSC